MPAPATGRDRLGMLDDTPDTLLGSAPDELDPLREGLPESLQELPGGIIGEIRRFVKQFRRATYVGLGLLHRRNVQKHERLSQMMVGAEARERTRRDTDDRTGFPVEDAVALRPRRDIDRVLEDARNRPVVF